jgi:hypothetical protein
MVVVENGVADENGIVGNGVVDGNGLQLKMR